MIIKVQGCLQEFQPSLSPPALPRSSYFKIKSECHWGHIALTNVHQRICFMISFQNVLIRFESVIKQREKKNQIYHRSCSYRGALKWLTESVRPPPVMESCCLDQTFVLSAAVPGGQHCCDEATVQTLCPYWFSLSLSCGKSLFLPVILVIQVLLFNYPMFMNSTNLSQRRENMSASKKRSVFPNQFWKIHHVSLRSNLALQKMLQVLP